MNDKKANGLNKKIFFIPVLLLFFISCHSVEEETDSAFEEAKESKEFTDDSLDMETEAELVPLLKTKPMKVVVVDPWTNYSKEIEMEIKANEKMINDLRNASGSDVKEFKKIAALEKTNLEFQTRMSDYKIEADADLEKFKSELMVDMVELNLKLKDFKAIEK